MLKTMSMHARLLLLGLLASLGGAGQAADSPFSPGSGPGLQVAVRLIADPAPGDTPSERNIEEADAEAPEPPEDRAPPASLPDQPASQDGAAGDHAEAPDRPQGPEDGPAKAEQEAAGESGGPGAGSGLEREPELAGQASIEEGQERGLSRIEAVLNRVDQILLDAQARARREREEQGGGAAAGASLPEPETREGTPGENEGKAAGEAEGEATGRGEVAEGQVPGDTPTGKTRPARGYEKDDDIVTRQVCELAEREEDPEVREQLEQKCKSLKDS